MIRTARSFTQLCTCAFFLAFIGLLSSASQAATISYGSFGPVAPGVTFVNVEESSGTDPVPLYGPPTAFSIGLDFNPATFVATSSNGSADLTDGQLNFTVVSGLPITHLNLSERGDYTLTALGGANAQVTAGASILATVTEINGVAVAPINLSPVNASVGFSLPLNAGIVQPWSLGLGLDVAAQVPGATRLDVVINDALVALSEPSSIAFIAKKDFTIRVEVIPEPSSVALASFALLGLGLATTRRRS